MNIPEQIKLAELADIFDVTERHTRNLLKKVAVTQANSGLWPFEPAVRGVLRLMEQDLAKSERAARGPNARAKQIELALTQMADTLIPRVDADAALEIVVAIVSEELRGFPDRYMNDPDLQSVVKGLISESLSRIEEARRRLSRASLTGHDLPLQS